MRYKKYITKKRKEKENKNDGPCPTAIGPSAYEKSKANLQ